LPLGGIHASRGSSPFGVNRQSPSRIAVAIAPGASSGKQWPGCGQDTASMAGDRDWWRSGASPHRRV